MENKAISKAVIFCLLIFLSVSQDLTIGSSTGTKFFDSNEGAQIPHLFSTVIWMVPTISPLASNHIFTGTIPQGTFVSTENVYTASAIFSLQIESTFSSSNPKLTFIVSSFTVNAARTSYTIQISFLSDTLTGGVVSKYTNIGLSIIIIGSDFSGSSTTDQSSYIYAKTSRLHNSLSSANVAQFDFKNSLTDTSPFDYLPGTDLGSGCGAVKKNGKIIIETRGCTLNNFYAFVTGFVQTTTSASLKTKLYSYIVSGPSGTFSNTQYFQSPSLTTSSDAGYIFKQSASDSSIGLWIQYSETNTNVVVESIQISFVFLGIRSYTNPSSTNGYPIQNLVTRDDFIAVSAATPIAGGPFLLTTDSTTFTGSSALATFITNNEQFGHAFCGFTVFKAVDQNAKLTSITIAASGATTNTGSHLIATQCVLVSKRSKCTSTQTTQQVDDYATDIKITGGIVPAIASDYTAVTGTNLLTQNPTYRFKITHTQNTADLVTISMDFGTLSISEYKLHLKFYTFATGPADGTQKLTVTAQGNTLFNGLLNVGRTSQEPDISDFPMYIHGNSSPMIITIKYTATASSSAIGNTILQISLVKFTKVLDGLECKNSCPNITGFSIGPNPLTTPPSCLQCDTSLNQIYQSRTGVCACAPHYVKNVTITDSLVCIPCPNDPLCTVCTTNTFACTSCEEFASLSGGVCVCDSGFYRRDNKCVACKAGCVSCSSENVCGSCVNSVDPSGVTTRGNAATGCQCIAGYYETNTTICPKCSAICQTCSGSPSNCLTCNTNGNFKKTGSTCVCEDGYYLLQTTTSATCQKCDKKCATCSSSPIYCDSCSVSSFRELIGIGTPGIFTCQCISGYVDYLGQCIDSTCKSSVPDCQTCLFETRNKTTECLTCVGNREVINGFCECKAGYYQNKDKQCLRCGSGCQYCLNATSCSSCALRSVPQGDGTCRCPAGSILESSAGTFFCRNCTPSCATCSETYTKCLTCKPGYVLNTNNQCVCPGGFYQPAGQSTCQKCLPNCSSCKDNTTCTTCAENYIWDGKACSLNCPIGYYNGGSNCNACPEQCYDCINNFICIKCKSGFNFFAGSCRKDCPKGTFPSNSECLSCSSKCQACSTGPDNCITCTSGLIYFQNKCVSDCPNGTYYADGSCLACSSRCLTCAGNTDRCTSCLPGQFLYNNKCFTQCPVATINGTCTETCPDGTFLTGNSCTKCDTKCQTCSGSANFCTRCSAGFFSQAGGICVDKCPAGTIQRQTGCATCDKSCDGCIGSTFNCVKCANGYAKSGNLCVQNCGPGFYIDASNNCRDCSSGCSNCTSPTQCFSCQDNTLTPINGVCQKACPVGASLNQAGICQCRLGVLHQNACTSTCPAATYARNGFCQPCTFPCFTCSGLSTSCLTCSTGYTYNNISRTCNKVSICFPGQYQNINGQCTRICPQNQELYNSVCIPACPSNFIKNGYGACIQSTSNICQPPLIQQSSSCVAFCSPGFYLSRDDVVCKKCPDNCQSCFSDQVCLSCSVGFVINDNNLCERSSTCTTGFQYGRSCVTACPIGTFANSLRQCQRLCAEPLFFREGLCFNVCPTNLSTPEACVDRCPTGFTQDGSQCKQN